jgi:hypothetical protein
VTGRVLLGSGNSLQREPVQALFRDGVAEAIEDRR